MKNGLIYGLLAGIIYMAWVIIGGNIFPSLIYSSLPAIAISSIFIMIFMALACQKEKAVLDGTIQFGEAFLVCVAAYAVFNLVYAIGFKFYMESSPDAMNTFLEFTKSSTTDFMKMAGASEDDIFLALENLDESLSMMFTWKSTLLNYVGSLIFPGALLALITAFIISKFSKKTTV